MAMSSDVTKVVKIPLNEFAMKAALVKKDSSHIYDSVI